MIHADACGAMGEEPLGTWLSIAASQQHFFLLTRDDAASGKYPHR